MYSATNGLSVIELYSWASVNGVAFTRHKCGKCSGRYDPNGCIDVDPDDFCDCKNGVLRWKTKNGKILMTRFKANPFKGQVKYQKKSEDERDWDSYVADMRNKMGDPNWNPISIYED